MDHLFLQPVPITIIAVALILILSVLGGAFAQAFQFVKDFVLYMFIQPLAIIWSVNTIAASQLIPFSYWNAIAIGVLNFAVMVVVSAGVNGGINAAMPDPSQLVQSAPEPPEHVKEHLEEQMQKAAEDTEEGN